MGYTTDFEGKFKLNKELDEDTYNFLIKLAETRRMKRDVSVLKSMGYEGDYGVEGEFFVDGAGDFGQDYDESIIDFNRPPKTQPGLWCQWIPTEDRTHIEWDGGEKFYNYREWLKYIIDNILKPNGYLLSGKVTYQGEGYGDFGSIMVKNNIIIPN